jgi:AraC-like DNA-binding protein
MGIHNAMLYPQSAPDGPLVHIRDRDEAIALVSKVYSPHRLSLSRHSTAVDLSLDVTNRTLPIVRLDYGAPVRVDADFQDLVLIMGCVAGGGRVRQGNESAQWRPGSIIPLSAGARADLEFGAQFAQVSIKPDARTLELFCGRWLGHPLEVNLRFQLTPFSDDLRRVWDSTLPLLEAGQVPPAAAATRDEFVMTLLLHGHPHNYTDELARPESRPSARAVRRAVEYIEENADDTLTASKIAAAVGVSLRSLQTGFRLWRQITPTEYLRRIRLQRVRDALMQLGDSVTITEVAMNHGFIHLGRFSQHYEAAFGERPSATVSRARRYSKRRLAVTPSERAGP